MRSTFMPRSAASAVRALAVAALAFTTLTAATCGGDDDEIGTVVGTYALTGVSPLASGPYVSTTGYSYTSGGSTYTFTSGTLTLGESGSFAIAVNGTQRAPGSSTDTPVAFAGIAGTWVQSGANITFTPTGGGAAMIGTLVDGGAELRAPVTFSGTGGGGTYFLRFEQD